MKNSKYTTQILYKYINLSYEPAAWDRTTVEALVHPWCPASSMYPCIVPTFMLLYVLCMSIYSFLYRYLLIVKTFRCIIYVVHVSIYCILLYIVVYPCAFVPLYIDVTIHLCMSINISINLPIICLYLWTICLRLSLLYVSLFVYSSMSVYSTFLSIYYLSIYSITPQRKQAMED